jgi:hypothetical protein
MLERVRARSMLRRLDLRHVPGNPLEADELTSRLDVTQCALWADKPAFRTLLFTYADPNKPEGLVRSPPTCGPLTSSAVWHVNLNLCARVPICLYMAVCAHAGAQAPYTFCK